MLTANVRNIMPMSENVPVTTTTLSATLSNGVQITAIKHNPVLCHLLLMINVRTKSLITKAVKKTGREPVVKPDMLTLVLRGGCMPLQIGVLMTNLMASAVALRLPQVVQAIIP